MTLSCIRTFFQYDFDMNRIARLRLTRNVVAEPPSYGTTSVLVGAAVFAAFALPLRIVWCRVQPLLVIGLVILGAFMRRSRMSRAVSVSAQRTQLSSYDILIKDDGRGAARWDEAVFVYAAWIA